MPIKKIMVVDDSPTERAFMEGVLKKRGYEVLLVDSGEQAIERSKSEKPDLILMDVVMPRMNGLQALRALRSAAETNHIPVILITTHGENDDVLGGYASGCAGYLVKPLNPAQLIALVAEHLGDPPRSAD